MALHSINMCVAHIFFFFFDAVRKLHRYVIKVKAEFEGKFDPIMTMLMAIAAGVIPSQDGL